MLKVMYPLKLYKLFKKVENGYDPMTLSQCERYGSFSWKNMDKIKLDVDFLENYFGSFKGKRLLDLSSGPGSYSYEFHRRGADVTCYDVSNSFLNYSKKQHLKYNFKLSYKLGHLEDVIKLGIKFDFIFNRKSWYYSYDDFIFANIIKTLLCQDGNCCIIARYRPRKEITNLKYFLYDYLNIKVGSYHPTNEKIMQTMANQNFSKLDILDEDESHLKFLAQK
jgi:SAM-dependent methyltransferase